MSRRPPLPRGPGIGLVWALLASALLAVPAGASGPSVEEDYLLSCAACHGPDGRGTPGVTPDLRGVAGLLALPGGREYLARVPGVAQAPLSDARLARLLNWTLGQYAGTVPEPPYEAAEIGSLRRLPLRDPRSARPR